MGRRLDEALLALSEITGTPFEVLKAKAEARQRRADEYAKKHLPPEFRELFKEWAIKQLDKLQEESPK